MLQFIYNITDKTGISDEEVYFTRKYPNYTYICLLRLKALQLFLYNTESVTRLKPVTKL